MSNKEYMKEYRKKNKEKLKVTRNKNQKELYKKIIQRRLKTHNIASCYIDIPKGQRCEICNIKEAKHKHHQDYSNH